MVEQPVRSERFGPEFRVKRRADFLRIQSDGAKHTSTHFLLALMPRQVTGPSKLEPKIRLGITVTTKVDKRAARRNRLKRRARECFRKTYRRLKGPPMDLVLIARNGATEMDYHQIVREFHYLLYQAELLPQRQGHQRQPSRSTKK